MLKNPNLIRLAQAFEDNGCEIRIVGGAVRDVLLGITPADIDLCTDATPDEMQEISDLNGFKLIPTGIQHGTVTLLVGGNFFEVTTLRIDAETDGRHATVVFTRSFEEDAKRRDLTFNAMSMDLSGNVFDYFNGRLDLFDKRVRFVGNTDARVKEDFLRILRFFRFAARFGGINGSLDQVKAITTADNLEGLKTISMERVWMEIQKLVVQPFADEVLDCMYYNGVLEVLGLQKPNTRSIYNVTAVGVLSTMVCSSTIGAFLKRWKLSGEETKKLVYLVDHKYKSVFWKDELVDGIPRDYCSDQMILNWGDSADIYLSLKEINRWEIPVFPVTGQDLLDRGWQPNKEMGDKLKKMRKVWKSSIFTKTKEDLIYNK